MTLFEIVTFYIALFLLMNVVLVARVIRGRFSQGVSLGDGRDKLMLQRIRVHGNFQETVIMATLGLIGMAMLSCPAWSLHLVGIAMILGRISHIIGMGRPAPNLLRAGGMMLFMMSSIFMAGFIFYKIFAS